MKRLVSILRKTAVWLWHPARRSMFVSAWCHAVAVFALGYMMIDAHRSSFKTDRILKATLIERVEAPTEIQAFLNVSPSETAQNSATLSRGGSTSSGIVGSVPGGQWMPKVSAGGMASIVAKSPGTGRDPLGLGAGVKGMKLFKEMEIKNPATVSFFGATAGGNDFVFVVDLSGSMTGDRFARAEAELERAVKSLYEPQRFYVIFFNQVDFLMPTQGLVPATGLNQRDAIKWFRTAQCGGGTVPLTALQEAVRLKPQAIFFLTDGEFDPAVVTLIQPEPPTKPIPIHCIAFASRQGELLLKMIAQLSGGSYRYVP
jgi:hypothetical protein